VVTREKFLLFARADDKQFQFEMGLANVDRVLPLDDDRKHHVFALEVREEDISLHLVMSVASSQVGFALCWCSLTDIKYRSLLLGAK